MTSKPVAQRLTDLNIVRSHSRPSVSNDNTYSEANFKTLKYCADFPDRFGSLADARAFCQRFFTYYNTVHRHSGIGLHTSASVHDGTATTIRARRADALADAYATNPHRFSRRPTLPHLPKAAWINRSGRLHSRFAAPDRSITNTPGRRRCDRRSHRDGHGLGRAMMSALAEAAVAQGARTGLLIASEEGQRLYPSLGRHHEADVLIASGPVVVPSNKVGLAHAGLSAIAHGVLLRIPPSKDAYIYRDCL